MTTCTVLFAGLAGLLSAPLGQCDVVYSPGPLPPPPPLVVNPRQPVDFDGDVVGEIEFSYGFTICTDDYPSSFCSTPYHVGAVNPNEMLISGYYAAILPLGELIDDVPQTDALWSAPGFQGYLTTSWWSLYGQEIDGQLVYWGWTGPLGVAGSGYMGVRFYLADGLHYGWIRVQLGFPTMVRDWAYETIPDTPILAGAGLDSDLDGVWDLFDECPDTPPGDVVDVDGCSISQLVPCDGRWKNHGEYVTHVVRAAAHFEREGLISHAEAQVIVSEAARSDCGKSDMQKTHHRH